MDIIENWNMLNDRMKSEKPELISKLISIHMGMFDDLRNNRFSLKVDDKPIDEILVGMSPEQKMNLATEVATRMISGSGDVFSKVFKIQNSEHFPNCIFIVIAAIIENLEGGFDTLFPDKKMKIDCCYEVKENDPLGNILPILEECYSWIELTVNGKPIKQANPKKESKKGLFSKLFKK